MIIIRSSGPANCHLSVNKPFWRPQILGVHKFLVFVFLTSYTWCSLAAVYNKLLGFLVMRRRR